MSIVSGADNISNNFLPNTKIRQLDSPEKKDLALQNLGDQFRDNPNFGQNANAPEFSLLAQASNSLAYWQTSAQSLLAQVDAKTMVNNSLQANGFTKEQASIAEKVLNRIPPANQANAIQLALGLTKDTDPLKSLADDKNILADKSGLSPDEADQARKDIIKAGFEHLQETNGVDLKNSLSVLARVSGADGNIDAKDLKRVKDQLTQNIRDNPRTAEGQEANSRREAILQKAIKDAAPEKVRAAIDQKLAQSTLAQWFPKAAQKRADKAYAKALKAINDWEPGDTGGRGKKNKIEREVYAQMNKTYKQNYSKSEAEMMKGISKEIGTKLNKKFTPTALSDLNRLASLIQASGIELYKPVQPLRIDDLKELEKLKNLDVSIS